MPDNYYQEYGPIRRRRVSGELYEDQPAYVGNDKPLDDQDEVLPERPRYRQQRQRKRRGRGLFGLLLLVALGVGGFLALPYALTIFDDDLAMQGVSFQGQPIAGMSRAQVRALVEERYSAFSHQPLKITFENRTWTPTLEQLGVQFNINAIADEALTAGHHGGPLERAQQLWAIWQGGLDIAPTLSVDNTKLQAYLAGIGAELEYPPRDASLSIAEGHAIPTAGELGRQILADATSIDVLAALKTFEPQNVVLRTRTLEPRLTDVGISPAVKEANQFLSSSLVLTRENDITIWEPTKIAELLSIKQEGSQLKVGVDPDRLKRAVEKLAQIVDSGSVEPRVAFRNGKLQIVEQGQTGWRLQQEAAATAISETLLLPKREMALPLEVVSPKITAKTLPDLGIVEMVSEGKSSFAGSAAYRVTNIKAGAARMNGVLIAPKEEFSFNTQLGAVDETNGFVEGYAVIGNRTQLEWGGGVCQVSTTAFRTAFWAGLPFTEWHAHPFYISWYDDFSYPDRAGPGMDATIYTGVLDLKFVNDTGHWLLMESSVDEASQVLTIRLYGTKPNRTVSVNGPNVERTIPAPAEPQIVYDPALPSGTVKQTDTARKGMDIAVYRTITTNGTQQVPETFNTHFKAWPNVYVRGTG